MRGAGDRRRWSTGPLAEGAVALLGVRRSGRGLPRLAFRPGLLVTGHLTGSGGIYRRTPPVE